MAQLFVNTQIDMSGDVSFGQKETPEFINNDVAQIAAQDFYAIIYDLSNLLPSELNENPDILITDQIHYNYAFSAYSSSDITFASGSATAGMVNFLGIGFDGSFDWVVAGVDVFASSIDSAVATSSIADDTALFTSLFTGNDEFYASVFNDVLMCGKGDDSAYGFSGNDSLFGEAGRDTLDGGSGADYLAGGAGNDTYVTDGSDLIAEDSGQGNDTVESSLSYTLGSNLENLVLVGEVSANGTGNVLNYILTGNIANNALDGGEGADTLVGGAGNDTYITDGLDTLTEKSGEGIDLVKSSVGFTLGANLENLTLIGSSAINGTGNSLNNVLTGNSGNNILDGKAGGDSLAGGAGDDTYITDGLDAITEKSNAGIDLVKTSSTFTLGANLENLSLTGSGAINGTGNGLNNVLTGNSSSNSLSGGSGNDSLIGAGDKDSLSGGAGFDRFVFSAVTESGATDSSADVITDFVQGQDKIDLSAIDAFASTGSNEAFTWRGTSAFTSTSQGEVRFQKFDNSGTSNDYTMVWIDNDADTGVEMAIRLTGLYNLTASDFIL